MFEWVLGGFGFECSGKSLIPCAYPEPVFSQIDQPKQGIRKYYICTNQVLWYKLVPINRRDVILSEINHEEQSQELLIYGRYKIYTTARVREWEIPRRKKGRKRKGDKHFRGRNF